MLESFHKNKTGIFLMLASSVCVCIGQLLWKLSAGQGLPAMLAGFCLYGIGAVFMVVSYRFGKLSILQPLLSFNYALSIILAGVILKEEITAMKCAGVLIIITGVICIAGGDKE